MTRTIVLPSSACLALEMDDRQVQAVAENRGVRIVGRKSGALILDATDHGIAWLADELQTRATSEYDLPFSIRGACGRVAKRLRHCLRTPWEK